MSRPHAGESVFRAVADPTRRRVIEILRKTDQSPVELATILNVTLPTLSHHLSILRGCGIVRQRRIGRKRLYQLRREPIRAAAAWFNTFAT